MPMRLHDLLHPWPEAHATPLSALDLALADWLQNTHPSEDPRHRWLAALTSHQWRHGHACLDLALLQSDPARLLGWTDAQVAALPPQLAEAANTLPWCEGNHSPLVHARGQAPSPARLYLRRAWHAEQTIREQLQARMAHAPSVPSDLSTRLDALFPPTTSGIDWQRRACEVAARSRVALITGGPGTGKTTTVVRLLALQLGLQDGAELRIHLAAPTGKAAARLSEAIGRALQQMPETVRARIPTDAQTLHRLLHTRPGDADARLASDVVVVDEASMVDLEMMARLLRAVPAEARLILLGDKDQLASVEAGAVMAQLCQSPLLQDQTVTLRHSHRFDDTRGIGQWAQAVNRDDNAAQIDALWQATPEVDAALAADDAAWPDVTRIRRADWPDTPLAALLQRAWREWLAALTPHRQGAPCDDAQAAQLLQAFSRLGVLCATRDGPFGVTRLTRRIEQVLGFATHSDALGWYAGRPVMVTRNDYALGVMNGDIGLCLPHASGELRVAFPSSDAQAPHPVRWLVPARLGHVETVWAMTVHKAQGSEFDHVLLALPSQASPVLTRELVYTGLTRARTRLTLWAPDAALLQHACAQRVVRSGGLAEPGSISQ